MCHDIRIILVHPQTYNEKSNAPQFVLNGSPCPMSLVPKIQMSKMPTKAKSKRRAMRITALAYRNQTLTPETKPPYAALKRVHPVASASLPTVDGFCAIKR